MGRATKEQLVAVHLSKKKGACSRRVYLETWSVHLRGHVSDDFAQHRSVNDLVTP